VIEVFSFAFWSSFWLADVMQKQHQVQMWLIHGKKHGVPPLKKLNKKRAFEA
jgi:hypothetical protein